MPSETVADLRLFAMCNQTILQLTVWRLLFTEKWEYYVSGALCRGLHHSYYGEMVSAVRVRQPLTGWKWLDDVS